MFIYIDIDMVGLELKKFKTLTVQMLVKLSLLCVKNTKLKGKRNRKCGISQKEEQQCKSKEDRRSRPELDGFF